MNKRALLFFFAGIILIISAGCGGEKAQSDTVNENKIPTSQALEQDSSDVITQQVPTETPEPTDVPFTPTPDLRLPPEKWQDWPIVPEVTNNAKAIFQSGITLGVNPNTFSKIGDCQNVKEAFLGIYDLDGRYFLREDEADWQLTIDNFKGFFNRDAEAFGQGLNVAAALSALHANPDVCLASESPIDCEFRIINPSFAFISFERWYPDVTPPDVYEKYFRSVIDKTIQHGTVPILVTKADNIEGNQQINKIIALLAYEYDIPLFNWWKAAQFLPNRGMDPERNDGFHISVAAWDSRSYYALQTLDTLWKGLKNN